MKQITIAEAIQRTVEHREVFHDEMLHVMRQIMRGELSPAQIAGFIIGLRVKKETIGEIAAAAQVMRELATPVEVADDRHLVDTCGTGGDAAHTFNVSTNKIIWDSASSTFSKYLWVFYCAVRRTRPSSELSRTFADPFARLTRVLCSSSSMILKFPSVITRASSCRIRNSPPPFVILRAMVPSSVEIE
jgi:hypothetical protein